MTLPVLVATTVFCCVCVYMCDLSLSLSLYEISLSLFITPLVLSRQTAHVQAWQALQTSSFTEQGKDTH
jgi:hypothetical protein